MSQPAGPAEQPQTALSRDLTDFLIELSSALHKNAIYPEGHPLLDGDDHLHARRGSRDAAVGAPRGPGPRTDPAARSGGGRALAQIEQEAGTDFDPDLVRAFSAMMREWERQDAKVEGD
ncbi:MAG: hypothetical protein ACJ79S_13950 [Gemmatimonadaceae bacterium]